MYSLTLSQIPSPTTADSPRSEMASRSLHTLFSASSTACARFFSIPELVVLVGSFLKKNHFARLMRVSQTMYNIFSPFLFHTLDCTPITPALIGTEQRVNGLAKNAHHVRKISTGGWFLEYYVHCQVAYEKSHRDVEGQIRGLPLYFSCGVKLLPPLMNLTSLSCYSIHLSHYPNHLIGDKIMHFGRNHLAVVYWLTHKLPLLSRLHLEFYIESQQQMVLLGMMLSGMRCLKSLNLSIMTTKAHWDNLPTSVFYFCPSSLVDLSLEFSFIETIPSRYFIFEEEDKAWDRNWDLQGPKPLAHRFEPLEKLRSLDLSFQAKPKLTYEDFVSIFGHCPNIEILKVPRIGSTVNSDTLGQYIGRCCLKLQGVHTMQGGRSLQLSLATINSMAVNSLEAMYCYKYDADPSCISAIIDNHSSSLRKVVLQDFKQLTSALIVQILTKCSKLEEMELYNRDKKGTLLALEDAGSISWASNSLRKISLRVTVPDVLYFKPKGLNPYFSRPTPVTLTELERGHFAMLKNLYTQIGKQHSLESLHLVAVPTTKSSVAIMPSELLTHSFPGMMSLGSKETGRPGYLYLLKNLKQLRKLTGSFGMNNNDTLIT
ncbi:hypothetical protein FBU30_004472, partial [Linnemannia zychae]